MADSYTRRLDRLRSLLREAEGRPLPYSELRARGIDNPAQAVYELELEGERVVHVRGGVALTPVASRPTPVANREARLGTHQARRPWSI